MVQIAVINFFHNRIVVGILIIMKNNPIIKKESQIEKSLEKLNSRLIAWWQIVCCELLKQTWPYGKNGNALQKFFLFYHNTDMQGWILKEFGTVDSSDYLTLQCNFTKRRPFRTMKSWKIVRSSNKGLRANLHQWF